MRIGLVLAALLAMPACASLPPLGPAPERPRDPWVFRSVLDQKPRIVTIALHRDLWLAYDATTCSLFKAWRGDVSFDGAVFTTVHGPQPTTRGVSVDDPLAGSKWSLWFERGKLVELTPVYRGHAFDQGHVTLGFELQTPEGQTIRVSETPEFFPDEQGGMLERRFVVDGLDRSQKVMLVGEPGPDDAAILVSEPGDAIFTGSTCILPGNGEQRLRVRYRVLPPLPPEPEPSAAPEPTP